ncbi:hypothetical protein PINS_up001365 [Pythium insidiosum]|nr:hypothetical protein PINS_up001365 [Pythium insidiosum]
MDFIALEGSAGVSVAAVLDAVDPTQDAGVRRQVWHLLQRQHTRGTLRFFYDESSTSASGVSSPDRARAASRQDSASGSASIGKKRKRPIAREEQTDAAMDDPTQRKGSMDMREPSDTTGDIYTTAEDVSDPDSQHGVATPENPTPTSTPDEPTPPPPPTPTSPANAPSVPIPAPRADTEEASLQVEMITFEDVVAAAAAAAVATSASTDASSRCRGTLMVAACEELRLRALNIPRKAILAEFGEDHLRILEAVGRARAHGITIPSLCAVFGANTSVKKVHNSLDTLLSYKLVVKRMMIVSRPTMRRLNIVHLPRFAAEFTPEMHDASAEFESDEQSKRLLSSAAEAYLKDLPSQSSVLYDLGRDLGFHKRHLEVLKNHIVQESKRDENFRLELFQVVLQPSNKSSVEPKILNCVRYKAPPAAVDGEQNPDTRGMSIEMGLLHQIYTIIEENGDVGTTIIDLRNRLVLPGNKLPYKLVSILAGTYGLRAEAIILGKNKAFKLYPMSIYGAKPQTDCAIAGSLNPASEDSAKPPARYTQVLNNGYCESPPGRRGKQSSKSEPVVPRDSDTFTVRANLALKVALGGIEVEGTRKRRRDHILNRLATDKIISISSLRASLFNMEKHLAARETDDTPSNVGMVDTRSVMRIANELESEGRLLLLQLPLPARNVSTKFRALRCVVLPGFEQDEKFLQGYVRNYCRDERLRRINLNVAKNGYVRVRAFEGDDNGLEDHPKRKRSRTLESVMQNGDCNPEQSSGSPAVHPEMDYKVRRFMSQEKSSLHAHQYRRLGFAYGVMFRCKEFHKFLWSFLHDHAELHLKDEEIDISIEDDDENGAADKALCGISDKKPSSLRGIVFSRETVLHLMPVYLYIQVFSGGCVLEPNEFELVQEAVNKRQSFNVLPEAVRQKIWSQESERTSKVLGTLSDLQLIESHKIGMKNLVKILQAGYTDNRDGILSQALKDNALGGLFRLKSSVEITLDGPIGLLPATSKNTEVSEVSNGTRTPIGAEVVHSQTRRRTIRLVGATEKTYSFGNLLPLEFQLITPEDVDQYWESLECLSLEKMVMEVPNPRPDEPSVCEVPKPIRTRARRMYRILAWIPKSQKPAPKKITPKSTTVTKRSGIVSRAIRARRRPTLMTRKRRIEELDEATNGVSHETGARGGSRRSESANHDDDEEMTGEEDSALQWSDDDERQLVDYFIENCRARWKIAIPPGLQRESETVAFRVPWLSRTGFGLVSIARRLGKRKIDVKKRLKEKLAEPEAKVLLEAAKHEMIRTYNPQGTFDEEIAIFKSPRLTALFRRAVMMIVSPQDEYHPLVAEELISCWDADEIRLVWRYLWLKNWIVRATDRERIRGYAMSQRLHDFLKVSTLSYPLSLFRQAAEQEAMINSTLEEIGEAQCDAEQSASIHQDHGFEAEFPANATAGQCALELGCQVMGICTLLPEHIPITEDDHENSATINDDLQQSAMILARKRSLRFLNYKNQKEGTGFAAHLAKRLSFKSLAVLTESWRVDTKITSVTLNNSEPFRQFEAFSTVSDTLNDYEEDARPSKRLKGDMVPLADAIAHAVAEFGEQGAALEDLLARLQRPSDHAFESHSRGALLSCLSELVDAGVLVSVNDYYGQRFVVKKHGSYWLLRQYSLVKDDSETLSKVVFEGEKDTISFPWLKMDGTTNYRFLFSIQRKILAFVLMLPGITDDQIYRRMDRLLTLQDTREALSLLVDEGLIYTRATESEHASRGDGASLFPSRKRRRNATGLQPQIRLVNLVGNVLGFDRSRYVIHYFPHIECVQRFGSIIQDYQHEIPEFRRP